MLPRPGGLITILFNHAADACALCSVAPLQSSAPRRSFGHILSSVSGLCSVTSRLVCLCVASSFYASSFASYKAVEVQGKIPVCMPGMPAQCDVCHKCDFSWGSGHGPMFCVRNATVSLHAPCNCFTACMPHATFTPPHAGGTGTRAGQGETVIPMQLSRSMHVPCDCFHCMLALCNCLNCMQVSQAQGLARVELSPGRNTPALTVPTVKEVGSLLTHGSQSIDIQSGSLKYIFTVICLSHAAL